MSKLIPKERKQLLLIKMQNLTINFSYIRMEAQKELITHFLSLTQLQGSVENARLPTFLQFS